MDGTGDSARFRELFVAHLPAVRAYARHRGLRGADVEDLAADVFTVAWRRLGDVPADDPKPWLLAVARNHWRNHLRAGQRRARLTLLVAQGDASGERRSPDPDIDLSPVLAALSTLSADDQELLRLVAWDELSPAQAAVVLGISDGATRVRLHRARARLAAAVTEREVGTDQRTTVPDDGGAR